MKKSSGVQLLPRRENGTAGVQKTSAVERLNSLVDYRLENWNERRAPLRPYFLRSFIRLSRVR